MGETAVASVEIRYGHAIRELALSYLDRAFS
jgi:hypothetical protein